MYFFNQNGTIQCVPTRIKGRRSQTLSQVSIELYQYCALITVIISHLNQRTDCRMADFTSWLTQFSLKLTTVAFFHISVHEYLISKLRLVKNVKTIKTSQQFTFKIIISCFSACQNTPPTHLHFRNRCIKYGDARAYKFLHLTI